MQAFLYNGDKLTHLPRFYDSNVAEAVYNFGVVVAQAYGVPYAFLLDAP
jgi:hypothetical protein